MKRYECGGMVCYGMELDSDGQWVELIEAEAELTRLRAENEGMAQQIEIYQTRERSWFGECTLTHGWQHGQCLMCTITRLRDELAEAKERIEVANTQIADRESLVAEWKELSMNLNRNLEDEFSLNDKLEAELADARALVEKREAQIEWAADRGMHQVGDALTYSEARGGCVKVLAFDGSRAGLLAAIDEATKGVG